MRFVRGSLINITASPVSSKTAPRRGPLPTEQWRANCDVVDVAYVILQPPTQDSSTSNTTKPISLNPNIQAVQYSWDPYETGLENLLLSSGVVSIRPLRGSLEADQSTLLHLTISAGCGPRFLGQQPMACAVRLVPPTTVSKSQ